MSDWIDSLPGISSQHRFHGVELAQHAGEDCILISVIRTQGSCPRDVGARMLVTSDSCHGTIGGGHLEYQAIDIAHQQLSSASPGIQVERFPLGARVGQCCGGVVTLLFEHIASARPDWVMALASVRNSGQAAIMVTCLQASHVEDSRIRIEGSAQVSTEDRAEGSTDDSGRMNVGQGLGKGSGIVSGKKAVTITRLVVTADSCVGVLADNAQHQKALARALDLLNSAAPVDVVQEGALLFEKVVCPALQIAVFGAGHVGTALVGVLSGLSCTIHWFDSREEQFPDHLPDNVRATVVDHVEQEVDDLESGTYSVVMTHSHALDQAICERMLRRDDLAWCGLIGSVAKRRQFEKRLIACGVSKASLARLVCPIGVDGITGKQPVEIAISVAAQVLLASQARQDAIVSAQSTAFA